MKRAVVLGASLAVVLVLAGCTPDAPAPVVPKVQWDGSGTSELESNRFVQAARAADLGYAFAVNSLDFSQPSFVDTHTPRLAKRVYTGFQTTYVALAAEPRVLPGPSLWQPVSVTEAPDGKSATVVVCDASGGWFIEDGHKPTSDLATGFLLSMSVESSESDSLVVSDEQPSLDTCDATGAPIGRFDPQPVLPDKITKDNLTPP